MEDGVRRGLIALGMIGVASLVTGCGNSFAHMNGQPPLTHVNGQPHMEVISDCPGPGCAWNIEDEEEVCYGCTVPVQ